MHEHTPFFFNDWYNVARTLTLTIFAFTGMMIMLRLSGKRTLSKLNVFDFVFVVAVGSILAATIIEKDVTLAEGMASIGALILTQVVLAKLAYYSPTAERIINGKPTMLLSHGKFIEKAMRSERVTKEEVRAAIREEGVSRVEDVDAVVLENDGTLTVAWKSKGPGESSLVDADAPKPR